MQFFILILLIILSACMPTQEQLRASWNEKCAGYGFQPNTPEFSNCLMTLELDRKAMEREMVNDSMNDMQRSIQSYKDSVRTLGPSPERRRSLLGY